MIKEITIVLVLAIFVILEKFSTRQTLFSKLLKTALAFVTAFAVYNAWINPIRLYREVINKDKIKVISNQKQYIETNHPIINVLNIKDKDMIGLFDFEDYNFKGKRIIFNHALKLDGNPILVEYEGRRF